MAGNTDSDPIYESKTIFSDERGYKEECLPDGSIDEPTLSSVEARLGREGTIKPCFVKELLSRSYTCCIDSRTTSPVVGTPGGDTGSIILTVGALEKALERIFSEVELDRLILGLVRKMGRMYVHTSSPAMETLQRLLCIDDEVAAEEMLEILRQGKHEGLLKAMLTPETCGCGHLRLMLERPADYGVRLEVVEAVFRKVLEVMWKDGPVTYSILKGDIQAKAVLFVHESVHEPDDIVHCIQPQCAGLQTFVYHVDASAWLLSQRASMCVDLVDYAIDLEKLVEISTSLAQKHLQVSAAILARNLPQFRVSFEKDDRFLVEEM